MTKIAIKGSEYFAGTRSNCIHHNKQLLAGI